MELISISYLKPFFTLVLNPPRNVCMFFSQINSLMNTSHLSQFRPLLPTRSVFVPREWKTTLFRTH